MPLLAISSQVMMHYSILWLCNDDHLISEVHHHQLDHIYRTFSVHYESVLGLNREGLSTGRGYKPSWCLSSQEEKKKELSASFCSYKISRSVYEHCAA